MKVASPEVGAADAIRRELESEAAHVHLWSAGPGDNFAPHSHPYEKVPRCVSGSITFVMEGGRQARLEAGEGIVLAAATVHSAVVGPGGCTCAEGQR